MADAINFVDANGLRFGYLEEGSGPLVLLLHGFPDTAHTWDELRPRIAAERVFGRSARLCAATPPAASRIATPIRKPWHATRLR